MYQYVLLFVIPLIFSVCYTLYVRQFSLETGETKYKNPLLPIFFICLFLILALRAETIGRDLINYKYYFNVYPRYSYQDFPLFSEEWLFKWTNITIGKFTDDYNVYLAVIAAITVLPIAFVYNTDKSHGYLKMIIFINMSTFIMLFSGIRQSLAIAFGMIAYIFVKKKKLFWFLVFALLTLAMHHSGFMVFLMYPMYYAKLRKQHLIFVVPAVVFIFVFKNSIFTYLTEILSETADEYGHEITETGAYMSLVLFALMAIFAYFITDDKKMDAEAFGLRNFLVVAVALQCFASLHTLSMRLNYYYIIFIPMAVGKCMNFPKDEHRGLTELGEIVLNIFFTAYFLWKTYQSFKTGISALDTIPYKFFWEI